MSYSRKNTCFYPYPIINECIKIPCEENEIGRYGSSLESPLNLDDLDFENKKISFSTFMLLLSILSLTVTIFLCRFIPALRTDYSYYQMNCYLTYIISNLFLILSAVVTLVEKLCIFSAVILHYSLLSTFAWMMVTGVYILGRFCALNRQIGNAAGINTSPSMIRRYLFPHLVGHILPAIFIGFCLLFDFHIEPGFISYGQGSFCWIGQVKGILRMFIIPASVILLVNAIVFFSCVTFLLYFRLHNNIFPRHSYMLFVLIKLLIGSGTQWLLGIMVYFYPENAAIQFAFVILVSTHGIFILACTLLQRVVRREVVLLASSIKDKVLSLNFGHN